MWALHQILKKLARFQILEIKNKKEIFYQLYKIYINKTLKDEHIKKPQ
jgi:hypothetical protein